MSNIAKVVLVRHGESTWNQENRFTGWTDVPLADKVQFESVYRDEREFTKLTMLLLC